MVTGHFGLDEGPFHGKAEGDDVYVGPAQSVALLRLGKALAGADSVVAVTGPVGVGKTTLVRRALADIGGKKIVIPVDRLRLGPDEILELLLARFEVSRQPQGTIQRVAAFRRLLQERLAAETRVFIVVEDAERIGVDALLELEALTSTDSAEICDAGIVLMGSPELLTRLASQALARLRQRVRLRQSVAPFSAADVEGYMRHCIGAAGGEFADIFEPGTAEIVYRYSGGVARVIDSLCESALEAAAEAELATILPELVQQVAENCGFEPQIVEELPQPAQSWKSSPKPEETEVSDDCPTIEAAALPPEEQSSPMLPVVETEPDVTEQMQAEAAYADDLQEEDASAGEAHVEEAQAGESKAQEALADEIPAEETPVEEMPAEEMPIIATPVADASEPLPAVDEPAPILSLVQSESQVAVSITAEEDLPSTPVTPATIAQPPQELHVENAADDSENIPTLSSSMRVAFKPQTDTWVRPRGLDEFPEGDTPKPVASGEASLQIERAQRVTLEDSKPGADAVAFEPAIVATPDEDSVEAPLAEQTPAPVEPPEPDPRLELEAGFVTAAVDQPTLDEPVVDAPTVDAATVGADTVGAPTVGAPTVDEPVIDQPGSDHTFTAANDAGPEEPELDALEAAIHAANAWQSGDDSALDDAGPEPPATVTDGNLPEITLDQVLEQKNEPEFALDQWADELSKAKSLEDISDILAETLFGNEELQQISDQIVANRPAANTAPATKPVPAAADTAVEPAPASRPVTPPPRKPAAAPNGAAQPGRFDMTLSQRIDMVNTLKKGQSSRPLPASNVTEIVLSVTPDPPEKSPDGPEPIEAQIDTAITQSRLALTSADMARMAAEEKTSTESSGDKGSRGLFGLFKRSSKS